MSRDHIQTLKHYQYRLALLRQSAPLTSRPSPPKLFPMPSRDYKGHSIRYVCSKEDGRWTASAVTLTAHDSSIIGDPIFLQETFATEAEAARSVITLAEASIDRHVDTPPSAP